MNSTFLSTRPATATEIEHYNLVENTISAHEIEKACDIAGDCLLTYGKEHKRAYNRAYSWCKVRGFTVTALIDWYTTDVM